MGLKSNKLFDNVKKNALNYPTAREQSAYLQGASDGLDAAKGIYEH